MNDRYLSQSEVIEKIGLSRMTIHRLRIAGKFPQPQYLTPSRSRIAWRESAIHEWMSALPSATR